MTAVVLNGNTYTDDNDPNTGMGNNGHRVRFIPCLSDMLVELAAVEAFNQGDRMRNRLINGACRVAQTAVAPNISNSRQFGQVDMFACWADGTVTNGTIQQGTGLTITESSYSVKLDSVTISGSGAVYCSYRMPALDAKLLKDKTLTMSSVVWHDVGSAINYEIIARKPTALDNYSSTTTINTSTAVSVQTSTKTIITSTFSAGDVTNGTEILVKGTCGAVTSKNFHFGDLQLERSSVRSDLDSPDYLIDLILCSRHLQTQRGLLSIYAASSGHNTRGLIPFRIPMRATPTLTLAGSAFAEANMGSLAANQIDAMAAFYAGQSTSSGDCYSIRTITADARL